MDDVDEVLTRLTETLRLREAQLAALAPQVWNQGTNCFSAAGA